MQRRARPHNLLASPVWYAVIDGDLVRLHDDPPHGLSAIYGAAPAAVEAARKYVENSLREAARWLEYGRPYVMGEDPDIAACPGSASA